MKIERIVIGCLGVLLLSSVGAGVVVHQRDTGRISELESMVSELQQKEEQSASDRMVSRQMEEIALGQQTLSEERSREAIRQSEIAQAATLRSEAERSNALKAQAAAEQSAEEANNSYQMAERQRQEANEQRHQAEHAKLVADTLNYLSLGRTLGSQSYSVYRAGDREIGNMLAYASYLYTRDYGGDLYTPAVFQALTQSAGGRQSWNIHSGNVTDLDFFPGTNRLLTVSTYGEMELQEISGGRLVSKTLFSNKNYCFRDVYASSDGRGYALSHTGHLVVASEDKTEVVGLPDLTKPFQMVEMNGGRQLLVIGESNLALIELPTHRVTATRQLNYRITYASQREGKPLLFDDRGRMHQVNTINSVTDEKVPVSGRVTAFTTDRVQQLTAYGMLDGTIYTIDAAGRSHRLVGHLSEVTRLRFVGRRLYSSSYDGKLLFWMTGENQMRPITLYQAGSWITGFTLDGRHDYIWTAEKNGSITRYLISLPLIGQRLRQNVKRNFTKEEWDYYVGKGIPYRDIEH